MALISRTDFRETREWCSHGKDRYMAACINEDGDRILIYGLTPGETMPKSWYPVTPPDDEDQDSLTVWLLCEREEAVVSLEWV